MRERLAASLTDRQLVLTVTNPDIKAGRLAEIAIRAASVKPDTRDKESRAGPDKDWSI